MNNPMENMRYKAVANNEQECYDIIDSRQIVGTEDTDTVLVARVFDPIHATKMVIFLEKHPLDPPSSPEIIARHNRNLQLT